MREQAVEPAHDGQQVLHRGLRNLDAAVEVLPIVDRGRRVVETVDHVVDGRALLGLLVRRAKVEPLVCRLHLGTELLGAQALELDH